MNLEDRIKIVVDADTERATQGMQRVQTSTVSAEKSFKSLTAYIPKLTMGFAAVGLGVAGAGATLVAFAKKSYDVAAQMQASQQVIDRLFKANSDNIHTFAKSVDESFGISERAALKYSATYGNLLSSFITDSNTLKDKTQEVLKQSAVVAAATGRSIEDVNDRIRSGLLGSTEAIEDLGINVNVAMLEMTDAFKKMSDGKSWETLDFNMQQQIRLSAILEQSYKKYGDSVNENVISQTNKVSAVFDNIQGEVGRSLLPIANDILPKIATSLKEINDNYLGDILDFFKAIGNTVAIVGNSVGYLVDSLKVGADFVVKTFIAPIASAVEGLSKIKIKGLIDFTGLKGASDTMNAMVRDLDKGMDNALKSMSTNGDQIGQSLNSIWGILSGKTEDIAVANEKLMSYVDAGLDKNAEALKKKIADIKNSFKDLANVDELELKVKLTTSEVDDKQLEMRKELKKAFEAHPGDVAKYERLAVLITKVYGKAVEDVRKKEKDAADNSVKDAETEAKRKQDIVQDFQEKYYTLSGETEKAIRLQLDREVEAYAEAGADKLDLQIYYNKKLADELAKVPLKDKNYQVMLDFEKEYLTALGKGDEAARLSIERQAALYEQAGADRVQVEEWAAKAVLDTNTDVISGLKRGLDSATKDATDYASTVSNMVTGAFKNAEDALVNFVKTGKFDFSTFVDSLLSDIARLAIKVAIMTPLTKAFDSLMGQLGSINFGSSASSAVGGQIGGSIGGGLAAAGVAHSGGNVSSLPMSRHVSASLFANAQRYHNGGLIGNDEVPIIAKRGERVLNKQETDNYGQGVNVPVNITVNNQSGEKVGVNKSKNSSGGTDIEVTIGDLVAKQMATSGSSVNSTMKSMQINPLIRR